MVLQLFVTCLVNSLFPDVGKATVALLERAGYQVEFPLEQSCCGQPAYNGGFPDDAAAMARHTLDVLDGTDGPIVVPSGSCAAMIIHHTADLMAGDAEYAVKADRVAGRTRELTQFLTEAGVVVDRADCGDCVTTYHASCHGLRELGIQEQPKQLLDEAGIERRDLVGEDECCGFGGLFSIKMPEVSTALMDTKIGHIANSGANVVVGVDVSCLIHIGGGMARQGSTTVTKHIAEVLAGDLE